jgi:hypothetical protein
MITKEEREQIVADYLMTTDGTFRFQFSFYQGINSEILKIPADIGDFIIREFQKIYGITKNLYDYVKFANKKLNEPKN